MFSQGKKDIRGSSGPSRWQASHSLALSLPPCVSSPDSIAQHSNAASIRANKSGPCGGVRDPNHPRLVVPCVADCKCTDGQSVWDELASTELDTLLVFADTVLVVVIVGSVPDSEPVSIYHLSMEQQP